jgi:prevent-host-death family protein
MVSITIEEISNNLPSYLQRVQAGESFVIVESGKPVAEVVPPQSEPMSEQGRRFLESLAKFRARIESM